MLLPFSAHHIKLRAMSSRKRKTKGSKQGQGGGLKQGQGGGLKQGQGGGLKLKRGKVKPAEKCGECMSMHAHACDGSMGLLMQWSTLPLSPGSG